MEEKYTKAFKEVYVILNRATKEEFNKIPNYFVKFVKEHMDKDYIPQIDFNENFENSVSEETLALLALIYRDYLVSIEERRRLIEAERKQLEKTQESYNIDNVFNKRKKQSEINSATIKQEIIEIKQDKWYEKMLKKILKKFKH